MNWGLLEQWGKENAVRNGKLMLITDDFRNWNWHWKIETETCCLWGKFALKTNREEMLINWSLYYTINEITQREVLGLDWCTEWEHDAHKLEVSNETKRRGNNKETHNQKANGEGNGEGMTTSNKKIPTEPLASREKVVTVEVQEIMAVGRRQEENCRKIQYRLVRTREMVHQGRRMGKRDKKGEMDKKRGDKTLPTNGWMNLFRIFRSQLNR